MAQAQLQEELIPAGGIADFVMSDAEIAALEAEEAREEFGDSGIARFEPIAKRMASYGRYGDDQVVHAETGELLVPRALLEQSPELKESIFSHLRDMGIEDPDRYVVGSSANSINPDTGMPEFFLKKIFRGVRKTVSNVAKGVSKAVSKVGKVLKKVAPVVLPIALAMTPLGAIYGAALGSGIGTLIQGGNIKDALKSALISGVSGAVFSGVSSKLGGGTFTEGIKEAAANPMGRLSQTGKALGAGDPFRSFAPTGDQIADDIAAGRADAGVSEAQELAGTTPMEEYTQAVDIRGKAPSLDPDVAMMNDPYFQDASGNFDPTGRNYTGFKGARSASTDGVGYDYRFGGTGGPTPDRVASFAEQAGSTAGSTGAETSLLDTAKGYGQKALDFFDPRVPDTVPGLEAEVARLKGLNYTDDVAYKIAQENIAKATPSMISRYAPIAGLATLGATAGGFFETPEEETNELAEEFQQTGVDLVAQNPEQFMLAGRDPRYSQGQYVVGSQYGLTPQQTLFSNPFMRYQAPQMRAAAGGEVYPRRNGGIMPNEGIPDQDSVRALLMPGEFVMTKDAVRGLGGGNLNQGINNMYSMMRNLETRGQVA
jgi:hypothetical protein